MERYKKDLENEIKNFEEIALRIKPDSGDIPELKGIDIYGETLPLNGVIGGDHIVYIDFNKRYDIEKRVEDALNRGETEKAKLLENNKNRGGILIADVSGHKVTDALMAAMFHQAFLTGAIYELNQNGTLTAELFETLNTRFFNSSSISKFITMIYGEISEQGKFRFINAGHPNPYIFSYSEKCLMRVSREKVMNFPPIGTLPSKEDIDSDKNYSRIGYKKRYFIHELDLMNSGDILILFTDGLYEHNRGLREYFFPDHLEKIVEQNCELSASEIFRAIISGARQFAKFTDDLSLVVIKKEKEKENNE